MRGRPKGTTKGEGVPYLSLAEQEKFIVELKKRNKLRDKLLFQFILYYGLRVREVAELTLSAFSDDFSQMTVQALKGGRKKETRCPGGAEKVSGEMGEEKEKRGQRHLVSAWGEQDKSFI